MDTTVRIIVNNFLVIFILPYPPSSFSASVRSAVPTAAHISEERYDFASRFIHVNSRRYYLFLLADDFDPVDYGLLPSVWINNAYEPCFGKSRVGRGQSGLNGTKAPPPVTPVRLWRFGDNGSPGRWDDHLTTVCLWCGRCFPVRDEMIGQQTPCPLDSCGKPLQLNPFVVDGKRHPPLSGGHSDE